MTPRSALVLAIVSGLAAVSVVALDTVLGLAARLDVLEEGEWETRWVAPYSRRFPYDPFGGCSEESFRLVVENKKPLPDTIQVQASFYNFTGEHRLFRETWALAAWETRTKEFTLPESAESVPPWVEKVQHDGTVSVQVHVDDLGGTSVCARPRGVPR